VAPAPARLAADLGQVKAADEFYRRRRGQQLSSYCQPCTRAASREARAPRRATPLPTAPGHAEVLLDADSPYHAAPLAVTFAGIATVVGAGQWQPGGAAGRGRPPEAAARRLALRW
jgi:hypothetical protein